MGVLPLQFSRGQSWESLGLSGEETFDIPDLTDQIAPGCELTVRATGPDGTVKEFPVKVRIDTPVELDYYRNGGILQTVLRKLPDLSRMGANRLCVPSANRLARPRQCNAGAAVPLPAFNLPSIPRQHPRQFPQPVQRASAADAAGRAIHHILGPGR